MKVVGKRPNCKVTVIEIENTLEALQKEVGGQIETVTVAEDCCIICNENGRLIGLPYNLTFCGGFLYGDNPFCRSSG